MTITEYLQAPPAADAQQLRKLATDAHDKLSDAGAAADRLLTAAERTKAQLSRADEQAFEELVQTLGALSREAWAGADAALKATRILRQLEDVRRRLEATQESEVVQPE